MLTSTTSSHLADNPPFSFPVAFALWLASILAAILIPGIALVSYIVSRYGAHRLPALRELIASDGGALFVTVAALIPMHLVLLALAWAVVTGFGKRPFLPTLGWTWNNFGWWKCVLFALAMYAFGMLVISFSPGGETAFDRLIKNSRATALVIAFAGAFTAPIVEEIYYRGLLYPTLFRSLKTFFARRRNDARHNAQQDLFNQENFSDTPFDNAPNIALPDDLLNNEDSSSHRTARILAILIVGLLFAALHYDQYAERPSAVIVVTLLGMALTAVRAVTGSILPCVVIHTVFNGIQAVLLVLQPYLENYFPFLRDDANQGFQIGLQFLNHLKP